MNYKIFHFPEFIQQLLLLPGEIKTRYGGDDADRSAFTRAVPSCCSAFYLTTKWEKAECVSAFYNRVKMLLRDIVKCTSTTKRQSQYGRMVIHAFMASVFKMLVFFHGNGTVLLQVDLEWDVIGIEATVQLKHANRLLWCTARMHMSILRSSCFQHQQTFDV